MTQIESTTTSQPDATYTSQLVRQWMPREASKATVVLIHGLAEHTARYEDVGSQFAESGFTVMAPDLFGFGDSGGDRASVGAWNDYLDQAENLIQAGEGPVVLMGHSMGGLVALSYALSERSQPDLLVLSAPAIGGGAAWQKALAPVMAKIAPGMLIPNNIKGDQLSRDPEVGERYFADPLVFTKTTARLGNMLFVAQSEVQSQLDSLAVPTLVMHGGADTIVPPWSSAPLGELPGVERRLYPKLRHEIFNEAEGPELISEIVEWVTENLKPI